MTDISEVVLADGTADDLERASIPTEFTAAHLRVSDVDMFQGVSDKDVRKSLHVGPVAMPELAPDEVLIAVMASSINYNTVWSATFEPLPTFQFLKQYGSQGGWAARHDQDFHVPGSDGSGVVVRMGSGVRRWRLGDHVIVHPVHVDDQEPLTQSDGMLGLEQRAWGYETNYGGLAHFAVVRASQLLPKPAHLTWEEAASTPMTGSTAYRMLVSDRGARMKQGDVVLIWGAAGGLGSYASQFVRNGGGVAVGVVSSDRKAEAARALGCDVVIQREEIGLTGDSHDVPAKIKEIGKRLGLIIRRETGSDPHIVFEHVGRATFGISMFVAGRGGTIVTCGSSSGYQHIYDNRYLWMRLKRVIGSHGANLQEQSESTRLVTMGKIVPALSECYPLAEIGEAARVVQDNKHLGKVGVLCLAPERGLGVTDHALRARIGAENLNPLQAFCR